MTSFKILFSLLLVSFLCACSTESQQKKDAPPGQSTDFQAEKNTTFRVDTYRAMSSTIKEFNSYGIPKKKLFNFQACLQERMGGSKVTVDSKFVIEGRGVSIPVSADSRGCLNWYETFQYNHIQPETLIRLKRQIRAASVYKGLVYAETAFSPWANSIYATNETRNFSFETYDPEPDSLSTGRIKVMNQAVSPLEISVDSLNFEFKGLDYQNYSVDRFLNLTVAHKYTLRLKPSVIRRTLDNAVVPQVLVGGRLKGYLAIFRDTASGRYDENTLLVTQEFNLEYMKSTGQFMADVVMKFQDVSEFSSRTKAILTLVPLDELEGIEEMNFEGTLKPAPFAALSFSPGTRSAQPFFKKSKVVSQSPLALLKSQFAPLTYNVQPQGPAFPNFESIVEKVLNGNMDAGELGYLQNILCSKLYSQVSTMAAAMNCTFATNSKTKIAVREIVEDITTKPTRLGLTTVEELEMRIGFTASQRSSFTKGWKGSLGAAINGSIGLGFDSQEMTSKVDVTGLGSLNPLKGSLGLKLSGGAEYNYVWEGKYSTEDSASISANTSMKLSSEGNTFQFGAKVRRCLLVKVTDETIEDLKKRGVNVPQGYYACSNQVTQQTRKETWYLVGQAIGRTGSQFSDNDSSSEAPLRMMVRGRTSMLMFYTFLKNAKVNLVLEQFPLDFDHMDEADLKSTMMLTQEFPGLLPLN